MCANSSSKTFSIPWFNLLLLIALALGVWAGFSQSVSLHAVAQHISDIVINMLKLVSLPMIFLSVVSTISGMSDFNEVRSMGRRVVVYALLTTALAATIGLLLFKVVNPLASAPAAVAGDGGEPSGSYLSVILDIVPSNVAQAFLENHVIGVMLMAVVLGLATLSLPKENKQVIHTFFSSFFSAVLKVTHWIIQLMPVAVWAFVTLLTTNLLREHPEQLRSFLLYVAVIFGANFIQAFVVLPLFAKLRGVSAWRLFRGSLPALTIGVLSRSSNAALPVTLQCAQTKLGISQRVSNFSLPLCATINMNGCAAFILVTVLYVAGIHGVTFSVAELGLWILLSTLAAAGNAGVPMGCYFLASAFLATMNVPLTILGMILPIYTFIDMFETGVNIWSDVCIAAVVDKELEPESLPEVEDVAV
jgi:Na+/H+-dicarboxylate symporter